MVKNSRTCAQFVLFMLALTLLLSVGADPAGAQSSSASGRLEGNIVDTSGSAVPSATVTVRKASAGVSLPIARLQMKIVPPLDPLRRIEACSASELDHNCGMCALSDGLAKSSVVLDRELDQEKSLDPSGPRIRCRLCGWSPRKDDR